MSESMITIVNTANCLIFLGSISTHFRHYVSQTLVCNSKKMTPKVTGKTHEVQEFIAFWEGVTLDRSFYGPESKAALAEHTSRSL